MSSSRPTTIASSAHALVTRGPTSAMLCRSPSEPHAEPTSIWRKPMRPIICSASFGLFVTLTSFGTHADAQGTPKKVETSKNVFLEIDGDKRRVLVNAYV